MADGKNPSSLPERIPHTPGIPDASSSLSPSQDSFNAAQSPALSTDPIDSVTSPSSKRRLGLFPRSNSQKWLHKAQHKRQQQKIGAWDDVPLDPSKLIIRFSLMSARHLANHESSCNPYAIISCAGQRQRTHAIKQTYDPEWSTTFDFPLDAILGRRRRQISLTQGVAITLCSKDRFKSVFLGQCRLSLQDLMPFHAPNNQPTWYNIQRQRQRQRFALRRSKQLQDPSEAGEVYMKMGVTVKPEFLATNMEESPSTMDPVAKEIEDVEKTWSLVWQRLTSLPLSSSSDNNHGESLDLDALQLTEDDSESSDRAVRPPPDPVLSPGDDATSGTPTPPPRRRFRRKQKTSASLSSASPATITSAASPTPSTKKRHRLRLRRRQKELIAEFKSDVVGIMFLEICHANDLPPEKNVTRTSFDMDPFVIVTFGASTFRTRSIRHNLNPVWNEKLFFHVRRNEANYSVKFTVYDKDKFSGNDLVASYTIPILQLIEQFKNDDAQTSSTTASHTIAIPSSSSSSSSSTTTSTALPTAFPTMVTTSPGPSSMMMASSVSSSSSVASTMTPPAATASTANDPSRAIDEQMGKETFPLTMAKQSKWQDKHQPTLTIRAKFIPYVEIRRLFWLALAKTYDIDENGTMSKLEVQAMLESLGSTISEQTLDKFWRRHHKDPNNDADEITMEQLAESLEDFMLAAEIGPSANDEGELDLDEDEDEDDEGLVVRGHRSSGLHEQHHLIAPEEVETTDSEEDDLLFTDALESSISEDDGDEMDDDEMDDDMNVEALRDARDVQYGGSASPVILSSSLSFNNLQGLAHESATPALSPSHRLQPSNVSISSSHSTPTSSSTPNVSSAGLSSSLKLLHPSPLRHRVPSPISSPPSSSRSPPMQDTTPPIIGEKLIRLKECPICHRPNLSRRGQMDIVTHVATCAANDWTTVDRFLMGNFITEQYAQRKWFVKLVSKVGYGRYVPGRNNANIIVQDRQTGQLVEERMSVYIRLGMRLVYKGMKTGIQSKTAKRILTNLTLRQGRRFDSPASARDILPFIKFHRLDMTEVLDPLESFKTFNEFFYRKLKPEARPCASRDDPRVVVSAADSRMMAFQTIDQATKIWIKGWDFTLAKLLDDVSYAMNFHGGSLAVFRLSPQDYHRFHVPVDGIITETHHLPGQYYTVNPMAVRTTLDVFGDNARTIVRMDTEAFGKVAIVCIGAMMVGSIILTAPIGSPLKRADELGYFKFGGSSCVLLFERDGIQFDQDLLENAQKPLETLVRVGEQIAVKKAATDLIQ
ncbi:hypothetical protein DM01DRAFT_1340909 [Hesseltinella vesiculosa]|uniref:Phosphatidylserine decarboxylase proenzyme 2 n=1 Tax=Hesseltinella vesiculosa TaxID=101127 RepID=A0A1X2G2L5_9FUNG|nr:hypothetical protein DM01DRAFT_1340909 [Hesseltinella vesiculosa]